MLRRRERRSMTLMAGSGRSGTSLLAGLLRRLGFTVPLPELPPDDSNPVGFSEPLWVVRFHRRLLGPEGVSPEAGSPEVRAELRAWLGVQLSGSGHVLVKNPPLTWLLPLWLECLGELGVTPRFATSVRHPAAVVNSKRRWYGDWPDAAQRVEEWIALVERTERASEGLPRAFVRYDDLLADWEGSVARVCDQLGVDVMRRASRSARADAAAFVDRGLRRSPADWEGLDVPAPLRERAELVWARLAALSA